MIDSLAHRIARYGHDTDASSRCQAWWGMTEGRSASTAKKWMP